MNLYTQRTFPGPFLNYDVLKSMIESGDFDPEKRDNRDETLVFHACIFAKDIDSLKLLVENGFSINVQNIEDMTPLHVACRRRNYDAVSFLMDYGADSFVRDKYGLTPFDYALDDVTMTDILTGFEVKEPDY